MATALRGSVVEAADRAMASSGDHPRAEKAAATITTQYKHDPSGKQMSAVTWAGTKSIKTVELPKPTITDDNDVIVKMTSSAICGSDLHLYHGNVAGMKSGQIVGHEPMGVVESVGSQVRNIKPGDRVVASFCLACGNCYYCKQEQYSCCDYTNPSISEEKMFGARTAGLLGHPSMLGAIAGGQAEYFRIPLADVNCLRVPSDMPDDKVLFLSDILPTAWHGNELAEVGRNDVVAIWGAGPVGILTAQCAFNRGARRVILVDNVPYRLDFASKVLPKVETVNFASGRDTAEKQIQQLCRDEPAGAPDAVIECVGMHYTNSFLHRVEMALGLETDSPEAFNAAITAVKKGGRIAVIGAYGGYANHVLLGAIMEKGLRIASGQTPVQKYWKLLLDKVRNNELDPSVIITHHMKLQDAARAYEMFDVKSDEVIKIVLQPGTTEA